MKKFVKYLLFGVLTLAIGGLVTGCYGEDIKDLQNRTTELEETLASLDGVVDQLNKMEADLAAALDAAQKAETAAEKAQEAADQAKIDAVKEAKEEIEKLRGEIPGMVTTEVNKALEPINSKLSALGLRIDQVEKDVVTSMIATLQLQKRVLELFGGDEVAPYITQITNWINGLKNGSVTVEDMEGNLAALAAALEAIEFNLNVLNYGDVKSINLYPSYSGFAANILVKGLYALAQDQGGIIDWEAPYEELLAGFFSWNPEFSDLASPLVLDFAAIRGVVDYNFGSGRIGGGADGLPTAGNSVPFKKGMISNATETSFVIKVNPNNFNLAAPENQILFVRGFDGSIEVNKYFTITKVEKVVGDEALGLTTRGDIIGDNVDNGIWRITVKLNDTKDANGESIIAADLDELVTKYTNGRPETIVPLNALGADVLEYIENNIPAQYLYRKYLYAVGITKKNSGNDFDASKPYELVTSTYEIGIYPIDLEPVYNRHTKAFTKTVNGTTQTTFERLDEFKFTVTSEFNQSHPTNPLLNVKGWKHTDIHNRFQQVDVPGPTSPEVPWEYRWIDAFRERENGVYTYSIITPAIVSEMRAMSTTSLFVERDGLTTDQLLDPVLNDVNAPLINDLDTDRDNYNPYDQVYGTYHGDNRQVQALFGVRRGVPFHVTIDNAALVSHFYVALDTRWALESAPSEINAWNTYTYDGLDANHVSAVVSSEKAITISVDGPNIENDVLGFRVFIVNYDGTLVDPDGKAFYVRVGRGVDKATEEVDVVWPTNPKYVTKHGAGNDGTIVSGNTVNEPTDFVPTTRVPFTKPEGMSDSEWTTLKNSLDGYDWDLKISYNVPGNFWDVTDNTLDNYIYSAKNAVGVNFKRYTSGGVITNLWNNTATIGFDYVNPRGITDNGKLEGTLQFRYAMPTNNDPFLDPTQLIIAEWKIIINKKMPGFPEDASYKTDIFKDRGTKYDGTSKYGVDDPANYPNHGKVLWAYPTRQMYDNIGLPYIPNATWTPDPGLTGWTETFPAGQNGNTGNYNYYSSIFFGKDSDPQDTRWFGYEANGHPAPEADAVANYPDPSTVYFAGLRFVPVTTGDIYYGSAGGHGQTGFINHDMRVYGNIIGLNDPVDRNANGTPLAGKPAADIFTNQEVGYAGLPHTTPRSGQMSTFEVDLTWGWGYISHISTNDYLYWVPADKPEAGNTVKMLNQQYPIFVRYRSFIQDLYVIESTLPDLIYNAEEVNWKTTDFEDIKVESLTGNAFFLDYHSPASYGTTIPREYTVVDVSIWTGTVDPSTGLPGRRNEYFNPLVPFDGAEYTNSAKSNGNNIVWKPINQQDTPGDLNGVITFDIMDEFGHTYRMKMDHTILMERSE